LPPEHITAPLGNGYTAAVIVTPGSMKGAQLGMLIEAFANKSQSLAVVNASTMTAAQLRPFKLAIVLAAGGAPALDTLLEFAAAGGSVIVADGGCRSNPQLQAALGISVAGPDVATTNAGLNVTLRTDICSDACNVRVLPPRDPSAPVTLTPVVVHNASELVNVTVGGVTHPWLVARRYGTQHGMLVFLAVSEPSAVSTSVQFDFSSTGLGEYLSRPAGGQTTSQADPIEVDDPRSQVAVDHLPPAPGLPDSKRADGYVPYTANVSWAEGGWTRFFRRERPELHFNEQGEPSFLINGVMFGRDYPTRQFSFMMLQRVRGKSDDPELIPAPTAASLRFSLTLGDHMVLQRAPARASIYGSATPGAAVSVALSATTGRPVPSPVATVNATADTNGVFSVKLPALMGGSDAYQITATTAADDAAVVLHDVLFGDVWLCGGQSNMQFSVGNASNATAEIAAADGFPLIRLFTTARHYNRTSEATEQVDLDIAPSQPWSVASADAVGGPWGTNFSAVCWFSGRDVFLRPGGGHPIGLVSVNWGGSAIAPWMSPAAVAQCPRPSAGDRRNSTGSTCGRIGAPCKEQAADGTRTPGQSPQCCSGRCFYYNRGRWKGGFL